MVNSIKDIRLWHITPFDLGVDFFNPTISNLTPDEELYKIINDENTEITKDDYADDDYQCLKMMRSFVKDVKRKIKTSKSELMRGIKHVEIFPTVTDCISKFIITETLNCYVMINGMAVFYDSGTPIDVEDPDYFSIPAFYVRQLAEDDFCVNKETSDMKRPVYEFMELLWSAIPKKNREFSASTKFRNNGISYSLCITAVNIPDFNATTRNERMMKNVYGLLDTAAYSNVLNKDQWDGIKKLVDDYDVSEFEPMKLSETMVFADNWSGVVVVGDMEKNNTAITWFLEFEIYLQSLWLMFDAYSEDLRRINHSSIYMQNMMNIVEYHKLRIDNDISSNMEQSRHIMRNRLIVSSDIGLIYSQMHGILVNRLKLNEMYEEKRKAKFAFFSDVALLIIAIMQIYSVINDVLKQETFLVEDGISLGIVGLIAAVCIWIMAKGR